VPEPCREPGPDAGVDHREAWRIAEVVGRELVALRARANGDRESLRLAADRQAHLRIVRELRSRFPDDAVLSEEGHDDPVRLGADRVWIVDPLDGTREYGEPGRDDWAVHVALVEGGFPTAAAVALPARGLVLATHPRPRLPPALAEGPPRIVVSRSRPPAVAGRIRAALGARLIPMGSAGAKAMAVVLGDADVYAHAGGQYEWDSAAPVGVAAAAGLHVSRLDGSPLRYNRPNPWLPDLLICRPEVADDVLAAV
jgi:3'(2'), 5'-bisphosphate nucleotidase